MKIRVNKDVEGLKFYLQKGSVTYNPKEVLNLKIEAISAEFKQKTSTWYQILYDNYVEFGFSAKSVRIGRYNIIISFDVVSAVSPTGSRHEVLDFADAFTIVRTSEEEDVTAAVFVGEFTYGLDGKNAFEVWQIDHTEGTMEEYEAYLKQPAIEAANLANDKAEAAEAAALHAENAALTIDVKIESKEEIGVAQTLVNEHNLSETAHEQKFASKENAGVALILVNEHNLSGFSHEQKFASKENVGVAHGLVNQLVDNATENGNTLKRLEDRLLLAEAIIGNAAGDDDNIINTVRELLAVFSNFPEGSDMATLLTAKVNISNIYNALDCIIEGKTLDARQGKVLSDAIITLSNNKTDKTEVQALYNALTQSSVPVWDGVKFINSKIRQLNGGIVEFLNDTSNIIRITTDNIYSSDIQQNGGGGSFDYGTYVDLNIINRGTNSPYPFGNINFVTTDSEGRHITMRIGGGTQKGWVGVGFLNRQFSEKFAVNGEAYFNSDNTVTPLMLNSNGSGTFIRFTNSGNSKGYVGYTQQGATGFAITDFGGGSINLLVTDAGRVGIKTLQPIEALQVAGALAFSGSSVGYASAVGVGMIDFQDSNPGIRFLSFGQDESTRGKIIFYQAAAQNAIGQVAGLVDENGSFLWNYIVNPGTYKVAINGSCLINGSLTIDGGIITYGSNDSAGSGYRMLRVPNN